MLYVDFGAKYQKVSQKGVFGVLINMSKLFSQIKCLKYWSISKNLDSIFYLLVQKGA